MKAPGYCEMCGRSDKAPSEPVMNGEQRTFALASLMVVSLVGGLGFLLVQCQTRENTNSAQTARVQAESYQTCIKMGNDPAVCRGEVQSVRCAEPPHKREAVPDMK